MNELLENSKDAYIIRRDYTEKRLETKLEEARTKLDATFAHLETREAPSG